MRNLIAFLIKNSHFFLFVLLEIVCFYFIFQYNSYQKSIFFNFSNEVSGRIYTISGNVSTFWGLRKNNEALLYQNAELQRQILDLEHYINQLQTDSLATQAYLNDSVLVQKYDYTVARVVNNSISRVENYIIINKGIDEGVKEGMGVVSVNGIVGFVRAASSNFSLVQSVLNPNTKLSCKIKGSNIPTTLVWDAKDYRYADLKDFPRFEKFSIGDTVVTSGVSKYLPEGFIVGTISDSKNQKDDNFFTLKVKLSTDFASLNNVLIINNYSRNELTKLVEEVEYE